MFIRNRQSGFTLVELVFFIVIVSVAVSGVLLVMNVVNQNSADPQLRKQALSLAEALLEEVQLARFTYCDPLDATAETATGPFLTVSGVGAPIGCTAVVENVGPEPDNGRPFDNVNDYVGAFASATAIDADILASGVATTGNYAVTLQITPMASGTFAASGTVGIPSDSNGVGNANNNLLLITVRVNNGRETIRLDGYRTRYAPNFMP